MGMRILLLAFGFQLFAGFTYASSKDSIGYALLMGYWEGRDPGGAIGTFRFKPDTSVDIFTAEISFKDTVVHHARFRLFFELNMVASPLWLDLVLKAQDPGTPNWREIKRMRGILRFLSADKIELRLSPEGTERYPGFDTELFDNEESMLLIRKRENTRLTSLKS